MRAQAKATSEGNGFIVGNGGVVSINVFSRHDDLKLLAHRNGSLGCPENSSAAETSYDTILRVYIVSNHNLFKDNDTFPLELHRQPLWANVYV